MRSTTTFYIFTFLTRAGMGSVCSIYVLYLLDIGLSYSEVALINALYLAFVVLLELPTGMLADGRGRGWSVIVGAFFTAVSGFAYWIADGVVLALVAELFAAIGAALFSGALTAWIADAPDRKISLQRVYANRTIIDGIATAIGVLIGSYIAVRFDRSVPFALLGLGYTAAMVFAWIYMRGSEPEKTMTEFEALHHAIEHLKKSASMRWALALQIATGLFGAYNLFWTPLLILHFTQIQLGWIWIMMYAGCVGAGFIIRRQSENVKDARNKLAIRTLSSLALVGVAMSLVIVTGNGYIWALLIIVHEFGRGALTPYLETFVQQRIDSGFRATYGSLQSFVGLLGMTAVQVVVTIVYKFVGSDPSTIPLLWLGASILILVSVVVLWFFRPRMH